MYLYFARRCSKKRLRIDHAIDFDDSKPRMTDEKLCLELYSQKSIVKCKLLCYMNSAAVVCFKLQH
jgi:hypothetical protein